MLSRIARLALVLGALLALGVESAAAEAPQMRTPASISGSAVVGAQLTAHNGTWLYDNGLSCGSECTMSYQWERCNAAGTSCSPIGGASTRFYTVTGEDAGSRLRVMEQMSIYDCGAHNTQTGAIECRWDNRTAPSGMTDVVPGGGTPSPTTPTPPAGPTVPSGPPVLSPLAPRATAAPRISGAPMVDEQLSATAGTWTGSGAVTLDLQWLRCDGNGDNCETLGISAAQYTVIAFDIGKTLRVRVTGLNGAGVGQALSEPTAVVSALQPTAEKPSLVASRVAAPHKLVVQELVLSPTRFRSRGPLAVSVRVLDTRGFQIEGALVRASTLPANAAVPPAEVATAADGSATLTFARGKALKARVKSLTVVLVVRRPGDKLTSPRGSIVKRSIPVARAVRR
jgi:hypothetical protein